MCRPRRTRRYPHLPGDHVVCHIECVCDRAVQLISLVKSSQAVEYPLS
jgi:hypothetical protein